MLKPHLNHIGMDHQNIVSIQLGDMDIDPLTRVNTFHPSLFEDWLQSCRRFVGLEKTILSKGSNPDTFLALEDARSAMTCKNQQEEIKANRTWLEMIGVNLGFVGCL